MSNLAIAFITVLIALIDIILKQMLNCFYNIIECFNRHHSVTNARYPILQ
jgi:hypothetical protein